MRIKEHWRQEAFIRSAKAQSNSPTMIIQLPVAMADTTMHPGADRTVLASVYILDGKAIVVPATRRCGILVVEWSKLMRYLRRRHKGNAWGANVKERFEVYSTSLRLKKHITSCSSRTLNDADKGLDKAVRDIVSPGWTSVDA